MSDRTKRPTRRSMMQSPWSGMSLPGLLKGGATLRAGAPAVTEPTDVETLIGRAPVRLTCKALNDAVDVLARKLQALGLKPGDVALLHLPNTAEAIIATLAVQRVGATPAPLGIFETAARITEAAHLVKAAAIVTVATFAGLMPARQCRDAAAACLSVRMVAAFGADLPEGVAGLDDWDQVEFLNKTAFPKLTGITDAVITFDDVTGSLRAFVRSHDQLIADAAAAASLARVTAGSRLLATLPPVSTAGMIYCLALPLLSGAEIELNALFDSCQFGAQLGNGDKTTVILPAAAAEAYNAHCAERAVRTESIVLVHRPRPGVTGASTRLRDKDARTVDVLCLGEALAASFLRATHARVDVLPKAAAYPVPGVILDDAPAYSLALSETGALVVSGALAPHPMGADTGEINTGYPARSEDKRSMLINPAKAGLTSAA